MSLIFKTKAPIFTLLIAAYFGLVLNITLITKLIVYLKLINYLDIGLLIAIILTLIFSLNLVFLPITIKKIEKPIFITLVILSSIVSYQTYYYGIVFDKDMFANIFETHTGEGLSFINHFIILWVFVLGIIPSILIYKAKIVYKSSFKQEIYSKLFNCVISLLIISMIFILYFKDMASIGRNNENLRSDIIPIYFLSSMVKYYKKYHIYSKMAYQEIGTDAKLIRSSTRKKNNLLVLVVGETARSQNYQLNGYTRDTNFYTQKYNIISFNNVSSCGTATSISVPCMFSRLSREDYDYGTAIKQDNLLDILKRAGLYVSWIDNDNGCKGVCNKVENMELDTAKSELCDGFYCYDEKLLAEFKKKLINSEQKDSVIILHFIGSHGPTYYKRYPKQYTRYKPDCQRSDIQNCSNEELVNTYDNTIAYTDLVLSKLIELLEDNDNSNTALLYVSDHGESLGEYGFYLHGAPYFLAPSEQTKVPLMLWFSPSFIKENAIDIESLKMNAHTKEYSHDNLFDSILKLTNVTTEIYNPELDIFNKLT